MLNLNTIKGASLFSFQPQFGYMYLYGRKNQDGYNVIKGLMVTHPCSDREDQIDGLDLVSVCRVELIMSIHWSRVEGVVVSNCTQAISLLEAFYDCLGTIGSTLGNTDPFSWSMVCTLMITQCTKKLFYVSSLSIFNSIFLITHTCMMYTVRNYWKTFQHSTFVYASEF